MTNLNDIITNNRLKTFVKNNKTIKKEELQEKKIEGDEIVFIEVFLIFY